MSPSSTVHDGQHDTKFVILELLLRAALVADEIWGFVREPARSGLMNPLCYDQPETLAQGSYYPRVDPVANTW